MTNSPENPTLKLLEPVSQEQLHSWLTEFFDKDVKIVSRETLRHRDLSFVERLIIADSLPGSLIYKLVLPPWDIEQELHQQVLIPSVSNSAQMYMSAHHKELTALFMEDLGTVSLINAANEEWAIKVGEELAKMHRAYSYRIDESMRTGIVKTFLPLDYETFTENLIAQLKSWNLIEATERRDLRKLANLLAGKMAAEPTTLVHGDFYAENIILRNQRVYFIDWSWFVVLGAPLMDLASVTMEHPKNANLITWKKQIIEAYCFESGRDQATVTALLPHGEALIRLYFLYWLVERRSRGIMGTTVGPVDNLIVKIVQELRERLERLEAL